MKRKTKYWIAACLTLILVLGVMLVFTMNPMCNPFLYWGEVPIAFSFVESQQVELTEEYLEWNHNFYDDYEENEFTTWELLSGIPIANNPQQHYRVDTTNLEEIDYTQYSLILCLNRKIIRVSLIDLEPIDSMGQSPMDGPHVKVVVSKEYYPNTVFIYQMEKNGGKQAISSSMFDKYTVLE